MVFLFVGVCFFSFLSLFISLVAQSAVFPPFFFLQLADGLSLFSLLSLFSVVSSVDPV